MSIFSELNNINVNGKTEEKNGMTYLSWAFAWGEVKKKYPKSFYTVYENEDGWNYFTDGKTCWVKTGVTVVDSDETHGAVHGFGLEHIEYLPVMDFKNKSIPLDKVTSMDVNKAIQRSLTKAIARHGLGLYIYAGEDLPESESEANEKAFGQLKAAIVVYAGKRGIDVAQAQDFAKSLPEFKNKQWAAVLEILQRETE